MTKVVTHFTLSRPLDEALMNRIADSHSLFGLQRVQLSPDLKDILVEWDSSRLTPAQVDSALHRAGIPAARK
jgi:hypothetical protein